jgi:trimethylamine--corrinoid protein Co-methyltransferase
LNRKTAFQKKEQDNDKYQLEHLRVAQGVKVDTDHLAVDVIAQAMNGQDYFLQEHTIKHLRTGELYQPKVGLYGLFKQWEDEGALDMAERALEEVKSLLASYQDVPLPDEVEREFRWIIKAAEMELS